MYLIIDSETIGLPNFEGLKFGKFPDYTNIDKYDNARIVQLTFMKTDNNLNEIKINDYIIYSNNEFMVTNTEFHGITDNGWNCNYNDKVKCLKKLSKTHYIVHAHGNNYAPVVKGIPDVIELTYVNKNYFNSVPELNTKPLPIANLDFPNYKDEKDINLNFYPFVK